jgi:hypothetical protein
METLKQRDGVPYSEQIRRALRDWHLKKGTLVPAHSATARMRPRRASGRAKKPHEE